MKIPFALSLFASTACAFNFSPSSRRFPTKLHLFDSVEAAIAEAQRVCSQDPTSQECKVAWDIVEELEAADSHRAKVESPNASTDSAALLGSFDILIQKVDGKMDQLKATTAKLAELGATDPSIAALHARADEMKKALADARNSLPK